MGLGIHRVSGLPPHPIPGASINGCYPTPLRAHLGGSGSRRLKPIQLERERGIRGKRWISYRSGNCCYPHPSMFEITAKKLPATYWFQPLEPRYLKSSFSCSSSLSPSPIIMLGCPITTAPLADSQPQAGPPPRLSLSPRAQCCYHVSAILPQQPETSSPVTPGPSFHHLHPSTAQMTSHQQSFLCHLMFM